MGRQHVLSGSRKLPHGPELEGCRGQGRGEGALPEPWALRGPAQGDLGLAEPQRQGLCGAGWNKDTEGGAQSNTLASPQSRPPVFHPPGDQKTRVPGNVSCANKKGNGPDLHQVHGQHGLLVSRLYPGLPSIQPAHCLADFPEHCCYDAPSTSSTVPPMMATVTPGKRTLERSALCSLQTKHLVQTSALTVTVPVASG